MSSFICPFCGKQILDTPYGYITECEHYPLEMNEEKAERVKKVLKMRGSFANDLTPSDKFAKRKEKDMEEVEYIIRECGISDAQKFLNQWKHKYELLRVEIFPIERSASPLHTMIILFVVRRKK